MEGPFDCRTTIVNALQGRGYCCEPPETGSALQQMDAVCVVFTKNNMVGCCMVPGMQLRKTPDESRVALCLDAVAEAVRNVRRARP